MTDSIKVSSNEEEKLLPCPFCGGSNVHPYPSGDVSSERTDFWWVKCQDACDADGPCLIGKANAIAAWNRRAPSFDVENPKEPRLRWLDDTSVFVDRLLASPAGDAYRAKSRADFRIALIDHMNAGWSDRRLTAWAVLHGSLTGCVSGFIDLAHSRIAWTMIALTTWATAVRLIWRSYGH